MTSPTLASFTATDGTGLWEVTSAGIRVNGKLYRFTDRSFVVCAVTPAVPSAARTSSRRRTTASATLPRSPYSRRRAASPMLLWRAGRLVVRACGSRPTNGRFAEPLSSPLAVCSARASATVPCATARMVGGYKLMRFGPLATQPTRRSRRIARDGEQSDRKPLRVNG